MSTTSKVASSFVCVVLLCNMALHGSLWPPWREAVAPAAAATGLAQMWTMFAIPPSYSSYLRADVEMSNGTVERWRPPGSTRAAITARAERWRTWSERRRTSSDGGPWAVTAKAIAGRYRRDGMQPVRVHFIQIVRRTSSVGAAPAEWRTRRIRTVTLDSGA